MNRFVLLMAVLGAPIASAYDYLDTCQGQPTRWANSSTTFQISTSHVSNELSASSFSSQLATSFNEWSAPGCSAFRATRGADINADPGGNSSANIVGVYENSWPPEWGSSTIGITLVSYASNTCLIANADMVFNGRNFIFNPSSSSSSRVDFRSVATHEAGHWAGINHSSYSGSSLWPSYSGGIAERDLTCDDTEAICGNSPSSSNTCTGDNYCACGVACTNGSCSGTSTTPDPQTCSGSGATYSETEPNDWQGENDVNYFAPSGGGDVVINGQISCGNNGQQYTGDTDWFVVDLPCTDNARFSLDWSGTSDLDFFIYDTSSNDPFALNVDAGTSGPSTDDAIAGGRIFAFVGCWEGATTNYTLRIDRAPYHTGGTTTTPTDDCDGVTYEGECRGDTAVWCDNGELLARDCADEGGCAFTQENGFYCLDGNTPADTDFTDTGDPLPLFPGCSCSTTPSPLGAIGVLPLLALLPVLRRRR